MSSSGPPRADSARQMRASPGSRPASTRGTRPTPPRMNVSRGRSSPKKIDPKVLEDKYKALQQTREAEKRLRMDEEKRRRREESSHKQLLVREHRNAERDFQRRELEMDKLEKTLRKVSSEEDKKNERQNEFVSKMDETLRRLEMRHKELEQELEDKVQEAAEAKGRLAHVEFASLLLQQGGHNVSVHVEKCVDYDHGAEDKLAYDAEMHHRENSLRQEAEELRMLCDRKNQVNQQLRQRLAEYDALTANANMSGTPSWPAHERVRADNSRASSKEVKQPQAWDQDVVASRSVSPPTSSSLQLGTKEADSSRTLDTPVTAESLVTAENWALGHVPPSATTSTISYPCGVTVCLPEFSSQLSRAALENAPDRDRIVQEINSGYHMQLALSACQARNWDLRGSLSWDAGEIFLLVNTLFEDFALIPPTPAQVSVVFSRFSADQNSQLPMLDCLCVADATLRAVFFSPEVARSAGASSSFQAAQSDSVPSAGASSSFKAAQSDSVLSVGASTSFKVAQSASVRSAGAGSSFKVAQGDSVSTGAASDHLLPTMKSQEDLQQMSNAQPGASGQPLRAARSEPDLHGAWPGPSDTPQSARSNSRTPRSARSKTPRSGRSSSGKASSADPDLQCALTKIRQLLQATHGTIAKAFDNMDFFRDGRVSAVEWQEGVHKALNDMYGAARDQNMAVHMAFHRTTQQLFRAIDEDEDGVITLRELQDALEHGLFSGDAILDDSVIEAEAVAASSDDNDAGAIEATAIEPVGRPESIEGRAVEISPGRPVQRARSGPDTSGQFSKAVVTGGMQLSAVSRGSSSTALPSSGLPSHRVLSSSTALASSSQVSSYTPSAMAAVVTSGTTMASPVAPARATPAPSGTTAETVAPLGSTPALPRAGSQPALSQSASSPSSLRATSSSVISGSRMSQSATAPSSLAFAVPLGSPVSTTRAMSSPLGGSRTSPTPGTWPLSAAHYENTLGGGARVSPTPRASPLSAARAETPLGVARASPPPPRVSPLSPARAETPLTAARATPAPRVAKQRGTVIAEPAPHLPAWMSQPVLSGPSATARRQVGAVVATPPAPQVGVVVSAPASVGSPRPGGRSAATSPVRKVFLDGSPYVEGSPLPAASPGRAAASSPLPAASPGRAAALSPLPAASLGRAAASSPLPAASPGRAAALSPLPAASPGRAAASSPLPAASPGRAAAMSPLPVASPGFASASPIATPARSAVRDGSFPGPRLSPWRSAASPSARKHVPSQSRPEESNLGQKQVVAALPSPRASPTSGGSISSSRPGSVIAKPAVPVMPIAQIGIDLNRTGKADFVLRGPDSNRNGIPDAIDLAMAGKKADSYIPAFHISVAPASDLISASTTAAWTWNGGAASTTFLAATCACGNVFMPDANFCRRCGAKRPRLPSPPSTTF